MGTTEDPTKNGIVVPKISPLPAPALASPSNKRDLDDPFSTSSDPPLFSSDDLPASSAENYVQHRNKRQHRRPWYEEEETVKRVGPHGGQRRPREKGPFHRNFDSGVWLGSDESVPSDGPESENALQTTPFLTQLPSIGQDGEEGEWQHSISGDSDQEQDEQRIALKKWALETMEDPGGYTGPVFPYWQPQPRDLLEFHTRQRLAANIIAGCADHGKEVVMLWSLGLGQIRTPTLRPLRYMTKHTDTFPQPSNPQFQAFIPAINLILSGNDLEEVPGEVYHLKNLHFLNLTLNNITELLPSIANLTNLRELNLGSNQLRYLPYEILTVLENSARQCEPSACIVPNPMMRPVPAAWLWEHRQKQPGKKYVASTRTAFLDVLGHSMKNFPPAPSSVNEHWLDPIEAGQDGLYPPTEDQHRIPSLLETVLRACYTAPDLSQAPFFLPPDALPHLSKLLQRAFKLKEAGGQCCTICRKLYIVPRTEWVEW
ncbi:MAG: hypothetical protein Q9163_003961, partial [Psora crenata]